MCHLMFTSVLCASGKETWCSHLLLCSQPNKVYIGGLPEQTREADLQNCFGKIGAIANIELKYVSPSAFLCRMLNLFQGSVMALWYVDLFEMLLPICINTIDRNLIPGRLPKRV